MSVAIRTATRIQDQDDFGSTPGAGNDGYALTWDNDAGEFVLAAAGGGVTDHGALTGLSDDDHTGYALLAGRSGGQTFYGGTDANDDITIHGTSNATRTTSYVLLQPTAGNVGIGTVAPGVKLEVAGDLRIGADASNATISSYGGMVFNADWNNNDITANRGFEWRNRGVTVFSLGYLGQFRIGEAGTPTYYLEVQKTAADTLLALRCPQATNSVGTTARWYGGGPGTTERGRVGFAKQGSGTATLFTNEAENAFGMRSENDLHLGAGGDNIAITIQTTSVGIGTLTPGTRLHTLLTSAATNAVTNVVTIGHDTSGTAANGFGAGLLFQLESSTTAAQDAARIQALWYEATHATRKADLVFTAYDTSEREGLRIRGAGSAPAIGFYGVTPIERATLATGAGASVDDVITALQNLGLVKQS